MRTVIQPQMSFGEIDISEIEINIKSRDDIPVILLGLQHIYCDVELRNKVFDILKKVIPNRTGQSLTDEERNQKADAKKGRKGMEQWKILVLGTLRLGLNTDYDRIHELAHNHSTINQMLGHSDWCDQETYSLQSIKDNLQLFTVEILDEINREVIKSGHKLIKKKASKKEKTDCVDSSIINKEKQVLKGRCDSFVVKTNVHFPTDIRLLFDSLRKIITETKKLAIQYGTPGWRQSNHLNGKVKNILRSIQRMQSSKSKNQTKKDYMASLKIAEYEKYTVQGRELIRKSEQSIQEVINNGVSEQELHSLKSFIDYAKIFLDQIYRRVVLSEKIPHQEKIFSIFEPHTEWINKGKAGINAELGLKVCVIEDQYQFILHHQVMEKTTDDKIAVQMVSECQKKFPDFKVCSFDKGFHSPANQRNLKQILDYVVLPKKGRLNPVEMEHEGSEEFKLLKRKHSAVESSINGLMHTGLDRCLDHGIQGLKRFVALAVVSRNIKRIGAIIRRQMLEKNQRKRGRYKVV